MNRLATCSGAGGQADLLLHLRALARIIPPDQRGPDGPLPFSTLYDPP